MASIFHLDSLSTLLLSFPFSIPPSLFLDFFQHRPVVAFTRFLRRIMHSVAFPFVSTSTVPRLPFLFSARFPFSRLFDARFVRSTCHNAHTFLTCLPPSTIPFPLPFLSSQRVLPTSRLNPYSSASTSAYIGPLPISNCDDPARTLSFDAVRCYNVLCRSTILRFRTRSFWEL